VDQLEPPHVVSYNAKGPTRSSTATMRQLRRSLMKSYAWIKRLATPQRGWVVFVAVGVRSIRVSATGQHGWVDDLVETHASWALVPVDPGKFGVEAEPNQTSWIGNPSPPTASHTPKNWIAAAGWEYVALNESPGNSRYLEI
jgi:hypothetical protein